MATIRLKIAGTYKREVEVPFPGAGTEPEMVKIVAVFNDVDPDQEQSEQAKLDAMLGLFHSCIQQLRNDKPDTERLGAVDDELAKLQGDGVTPKIDRILAGVELPAGVEVIGKDGEPLAGRELLEFAKRYPRWRQRFLKKYQDENESGEESPALGNLLRSVRPGRA